MTIDPDVRIIAGQFNLDPALLQAVVNAEGDIVKAVQCSLPAITTRESALRVTCRSAIHAMCDFIKQPGPWTGGTLGENLQEDFVRFWAARWAPEGAENDPQQLNAHWPVNVYALWSEAEGQTRA